MNDLLHPTWLVFLLALGTALATGLGALPFLFTKRLDGPTVAYTNAIAAGLMLGASFELLREGRTHGTWQTIVGAAAGLLFIYLAERLLGEKNLKFGKLRDASARKVLLMLVVMTAHSFSEGVAVGVSFGGGVQLGLGITIAIAVHNIPEGVAISATMRPNGTSLLACAGWSVFSSLPQPLMAVPAYLFVDTFRPLLPYGLGFAAGAMVLVVFMELIPDAYESSSKTATGLLVSLSLGLMILFQHYL